MRNDDKSYCHVSKRQPFSSLLEIEAKEAQILESEHRSLSDRNADFLGLEIEINHKINDNEYGELPDEIQDLCRGLPTYSVNYVKTELSMDTFMHEDRWSESQSAGSHISLLRPKRDVYWSTCRSTESIVSHQFVNLNLSSKLYF